MILLNDGFLYLDMFLVSTFLRHGKNMGDSITNGRRQAENRFMALTFSIAMALSALILQPKYYTQIV